MNNCKDCTICRGFAIKLKNNKLTTDELISIGWLACKGFWKDDKTIKSIIWRAMTRALKEERQDDKPSKRKTIYNNSIVEGYEDSNNNELEHLLVRLKDFKFTMGYGSPLKGHEVEVFCYVKLEKRKVSEIAKLYNVSRATIYNFVNKLMKELRKAVK